MFEIQLSEIIETIDNKRWKKYSNGIIDLHLQNIPLQDSFILYLGRKK